MIYSALKNGSPMVVTAGQQDTRMRLRDPVLGHDLAAMAAPVTKWSVQVESADELGPILQRAFKIASEAPAGPVFVALPINVMEQETAVPPGKPATLFTASRPDPAGIEAMARLIVAAQNPAIVAGDDVARAGAGPLLEKLVERIGAAVWFEGLRGRNSFPTDHPAYRGTLAFDAPGVARQLGDYDLVLLVGGPFFEEVWYAPGSPLPPGCKVLQIEAAPPRLAYNFAVDAGVIADVGAALEALWQATTGVSGAAVRARQDAVPQAPAGRRCAPRRRGCRRPGRGRRPRCRAPWPSSRPARRPTSSWSTRPSRPTSTCSRPSPSTDPATISAVAAAASARAWPARSASRSPRPAGRSSACRATARRCTPSRRCGRRRITTCRSCSSSWPTASTAC